MIENWRPVVGYEDYYEVSDQGRVRSVTRVVINKKGREQTFKGRILAGGMSMGYPSILLWRNRKYQCFKLHNLVAIAFIGPKPHGQEIRHYDGDKSNCTLGNLLYGTQQDNMADRKRHGVDNAGERHGMSLLTTAEVLKIRKLKGKLTQEQIAKRFGVNPSAISRIHSKTRWGHL
jgi:NUMOD4 motif/HNH endonuclease/Helix-turn-helix